MAARLSGKRIYWKKLTAVYAKWPKDLTALFIFRHRTAMAAGRPPQTTIGYYDFCQRNESNARNDEIVRSLSREGKTRADKPRLKFMKITKTPFILLSAKLFLVLILWAPHTAGQERPEKLPPSISTSGEAIVTVQPDRARIDIGVVTQATSSEAAAAQNAAKLQSTLTRLRGLLGAGADIKTISYTLTPTYRYPREGGEPTLTGYTAANIVRVTLDDLTQVGKAIDVSTQAGANRIQQLQFLIKDEQTPQSQALRDASIKARQKANAIAAALGVRITRILNVSETGQVSIPMREMSMARADTAQTPIEPGTIEVRASVTLTVEIAQ